MLDSSRYFVLTVVDQVRLRAPSRSSMEEGGADWGRLVGAVCWGLGQRSSCVSRNGLPRTNRVVRLQRRAPRLGKVRNPLSLPFLLPPPTNTSPPPSHFYPPTGARSEPQRVQETMARPRLRRTSPRQARATSPSSRARRSTSRLAAAVRRRRGARLAVGEGWEPGRGSCCRRRRLLRLGDEVGKERCGRRTGRVRGLGNVQRLLGELCLVWGSRVGGS